MTIQRTFGMRVDADLSSVDIAPRCPSCQRKFGENLHPNSTIEFRCSNHMPPLRFVVTRKDGIDVSVKVV